MANWKNQHSESQNDIEFDITNLENNVADHVAQEFTDYLDLSEETDKIKVVNDIDGQVDLHELKFLTSQNEQLSERSEIHATLESISQNTLEQVLNNGNEKEKTAIGAVKFALTHDLAIAYKSSILADQPSWETDLFDLDKAEQSMDVLGLPNVYGQEAWLQQFLQSWSPLAKDILTTWVQQLSEQVTHQIMPDLMKATNEYITINNNGGVDEDNASLTREEISVYEQDMDILLDGKKWNKKKTRLAAKLWLTWAFAVLAWVLWFRSFKKAVSTKNKQWFRERAWNTVKGVAWIGIAWMIGYRYFNKQEAPVGTLPSAGIAAPEKEELEEAAESLDPVRYALYKKTMSSINVFYSQQIGYSSDTWISDQADMSGEYETNDMSEEVWVGELFFFSETHTNVKSLLDNTELLKKILKKNTLWALSYLIENMPSWSIHAIKLFLKPFFAASSLLPKLEKAKDVNWLKSFIHDLENNEEAMTRLSNSLRRWVKYRSFLLYQKDNVSYHIASTHLLQHDSEFRAMSEDDQIEYVMKKLEDETFMETVVLPVLQKDFLWVRPEKAIQYLSKNWLLEWGTPIDKQLKDRLSETKKEYQDLIWFDEKTGRSVLDDMALSSVITKEDKSEFDTVLGEFEDVLWDFSDESLWIKSFPLADAFDMNNDVESTLAKTIGIDWYLDAISLRIVSLKNSSHISPDDVRELQQEIQDFYWMKQELQIGSFFTLEHLNGNPNVLLRITTALGQTRESGSLLYSHLAHTIDAIKDPNKDLEWARVWEWWAIAWGMWITLVGTVWWTKKIIKAASPRVLLKTWVNITKLWLWVWLSRISPTRFPWRYAHNKNLFKKHILSGKISIEQWVKIAKKLWNKHKLWKIWGTDFIVNENQLYSWLDNSLTDKHISLLQKYQHNPGFMKQFFTKTYVWSTIKQYQRLSSKSFQYDFNISKFKQLKKIDKALQGLAWAEKDVFQKMLLSSRSLDNVEVVIRNPLLRKRYMGLFAQLQKIGSWVDTQTFAQLIKRGNIDNLQDINNISRLLSTHSASITHPWRFMSNILRQQPIPRVLEATDVARFNNISRISRLNPLLWKIAPEKLAVSQKIRSWMIDTLNKTPRLKSPQVKQTLHFLRRASWASAESIGRVLVSAKQTSSSVFRYLWRWLVFAWAIVEPIETFMTYQEAQAMKSINPELAKSLDTKWKIEAGLAGGSIAALMFVPWVWWIAAGVWFALMWLWEAKNAAFDGIESYQTNYKQYLHMGKVAALNRTIAHISQQSWDDAWWKQPFSEIMPWYDFDELFGTTTDAAIQALVMLDEIEHRFPFAVYGEMEDDEIKWVYEALLSSKNSQHFKLLYPDIAWFISAIQTDYDQAKDSAQIRYQDLKQRLWTKKDGTIHRDAHWFQQANARNRWAEYIMKHVNDTRDSEVTMLAQEKDRQSFDMINDRFVVGEDSMKDDMHDARNIETLGNAWKIQYPLQLILYKVATEVHDYDIQPPWDRESLKRFFSSSQADIHGLYVFDDGTGIWVNDEFSFDTRLWLDSGLGEIKKFFSGLNKAINDTDLVSTKTDAGEGALSREYGSKYEIITNEVMYALGDGIDKNTAQKNFLTKTILEETKAYPWKWIRPSIEDIIIWDQLEFSNLWNALYKYDGETVQVWDEIHGEQNLFDIPFVKGIFTDDPMV